MRVYPQNRREKGQKYERGKDRERELVADLIYHVKTNPSEKRGIEKYCTTS